LYREGVTVFSLIKRAAKKRPPIRQENCLEFRVFVPMKGLIIVAVAINGLFTFLTMYAASTDPGTPFWLPFVFLAIGIVAVFAAPAPVIVDDAGVRQNYWWRRNKQIPWKEVVEAVREPETDRTMVRGKWGTCISLSEARLGSVVFPLDKRLTWRSAAPKLVPRASVKGCSRQPSFRALPAQTVNKLALLGTVH
jgi:hypothetical protein